MPEGAGARGGLGEGGFEAGLGGSVGGLVLLLGAGAGAGAGLVGDEKKAGGCVVGEGLVDFGFLEAVVEESGLLMSDAIEGDAEARWAVDGADASNGGCCRLEDFLGREEPFVTAEVGGAVTRESGFLVGAARVAAAVGGSESESVSSITSRREWRSVFCK